MEGLSCAWSSLETCNCSLWSFGVHEMRTGLPLMFCLLFSAITAQVQTRDLEDLPPLTEQQSIGVQARLREPSKLDLTIYAFPSESAKADNRRNLPDLPRPQVESDADQTSLSQGGKHSREFSYASDYDPLHLNQPDRTWFRAMAHPANLIPTGLLVGLTAIQLVKTDKCIEEHKPVCNLIFRKNRAAAYSFNIPFTVGVAWLAGRMKEKGNGTASVVLTSLSLIFAAPVAYTANPKVLTCQAGRNPQCQ